MNKFLSYFSRPTSQLKKITKLIHSQSSKTNLSDLIFHSKLSHGHSRRA